MPYTQTQIDQANQTDLVAFLSAQGEELISSGNEYRWKEHDSMTIKNNKWFWHSQNVGGYPVDFLMKVYGFSFTQAMEMLTEQKGFIMNNNYYDNIDDCEIIDIQTEQPLKEKIFTLPNASVTDDILYDYLCNERGIDNFTVNVFSKCGLIYEEAEYHNIVFQGMDNDYKTKYAHKRSADGKIKMDLPGSNKAYGFNIRCVESDKLFVFESPIDLMSFISMYYKEKTYPNCVALGGISPLAMNRFLKDNPFVTKVYLCLDNDEAGKRANKEIAGTLKGNYSVALLTPSKKDWNDVLIEHNTNPDFDITPDKTQVSAIKPVKMLKMNDIVPEEVDYLWYPYIPLGKYTLLEGDSGLGKTTIAMQIIAACTTGNPLPGETKRRTPINVIYQTAEDGYADTIVPRLITAGADLSRVTAIDDSENSLCLSDERIGRAIRENNAKLIVLDPIQAFLGSGTDMNRANEVRPILSKIGKIAAETGCAVLLIGHLNKNNSANASQRGLGSIDIIAAARSVLLVGAQKDDFHIRAMCHIKSSLCPAGPTLGFSLGTEDGFEWLGEVDIVPNDLASGKEIKTETKREKARNLILKFLTEVEEMNSDELMKKVISYNIGERTYRDAYSQLGKEGKINYQKVGEKWFANINEPMLTNEEKTMLQSN